MSHTPAPWTVGGKYKSDVYGRNGLTAVARSFMSNIGENEQKANARLIAAAPELLEALKSIVALEKNPEDEWDAVEVVIPKMCEIARAAIAKTEVTK